MAKLGVPLQVNVDGFRCRCVQERKFKGHRLSNTQVGAWACPVLHGVSVASRRADMRPHLEGSNPSDK